MKQKTLYTSIAESSRGIIAFTEQSADLYTPSCQLFIQSKGEDATFSLYGWGNIPGVQEIGQCSSATKGGFFMSKQDGRLYLVKKGFFEVNQFNQLAMSIDIKYNFELNIIDPYKYQNDVNQLHLTGEMHSIKMKHVIHYD
ncbi:MAG: hypothetical protein AAFQ94_08245 [Bacteroidota bacterium]